MLPAKTLSQFEELLPDSRVEQLLSRLRRDLKLPDVVEFATYIQPEQRGVKSKTPMGIEFERTIPAQAFFLVVSPNPHERLKTQKIKSYAFCALTDWREKENGAWRFVGIGDPALPIFKALCIQHLASRQNYEELI